MVRRYAAVKKRTGPDTLNELFFQTTFLLGRTRRLRTPR